MIRITRTIGIAALCLAWFATVAPPEAEAQRRAIRRPGTRSVVVVSPGVFRPFFHRSAFLFPGFYPGFYAGFYHPFYYSPYHWGYYGHYPYAPYGWRYYDDTGAARIQVAPRNAEVFIDGYFVGTVDDFDGVFQRLHVPAGEHDLAIYLQGYKTIREKVLFRRGATLKVSSEMQPLAPGEPNEPRPTPDPNGRAPQDPNRRPARPYTRGPQSEFGTLSLRVQPDGADVFVDGEQWDRPAGEDRFTIDLPEGPHRLEVRKDGFRSYTRTVDIRRGQTMTLNVSLTTGGAVPVSAPRRE